jgi:hypothetical protein
MTCSHRSAAIAVAVLLFVAGAQAAADRGKDISEKEGKQILAIFAEHRGLLRVMRRALDAIEKKPTKKANGKRGLLQESDKPAQAVVVQIEVGTHAPDAAAPQQPPRRHRCLGDAWPALSSSSAPAPLSHRHPPPPLNFSGGR